MNSVFGDEKTATVNRLSYTGDKAVYALNGTVKGFLLPAGANMAQGSGVEAYSQGYTFRCDGAGDILASDQVVIDSETYTVGGVRRYRAFTIDVLDVLLQKPIKAA